MRRSPRAAALLLAISLLCPIVSQSLHAEESHAALFPPYIATAIITRDTEHFRAGERVWILEGESEKHYIVKGKDGARRRVPWDALLPEALKPPALPNATVEDAAALVSELGLGSKTEFLLFIDLWRLRVYVLEATDDGWQAVKALSCSVGDARHPTPRGCFEVRYKCACIGKEGHYLCKHALCFYGGYMLHSVLYDWNGREVIDGRLAERISHGCIRLSPMDIRWLYEKIPIGTTVYIR